MSNNGSQANPATFAISIIKQSPLMEGESETVRTALEGFLNTYRSIQELAQE